MKLEDHAISSSIKGKLLWCVFANQSRLYGLMRHQQLDAGMHPAKEGFSALPFFDEFDLSTVDILLISQYVEYLVSLLLFSLLVVGMSGCHRVLRHLADDGTTKSSSINGGVALLAIRPLHLSCIQETQYELVHLVFCVPSSVFRIIISSGFMRWSSQPID
jgi:hypothetical protein